MPDIDLPVTYAECRWRWHAMRAFIFVALDENYKTDSKGHHSDKQMDQIERFEQDVFLRETVCEVLLACALWIEAKRPCESLLKNYVPEIKSQLVYGANVFLDFLELRSAVQKEVVVSRGSLADAWIHLFAEFRDELTGKGRLVWWKRQELPYGTWQ